MIIHIVRHAEAVERSADIPEEHRFLTRRGRKRFRKVGKSLRKLGIEPDVIVTSPMIRAVQTADILADALRYDGELLVAALLAPGFRPQALDELLSLSGYPKAKEVALVGHEPDLGILTQRLLATEGACSLDKGAVVSLKRAAGDQGGAELIQLVTGTGRIITSRSKALDRLQDEREHK